MKIICPLEQIIFRYFGIFAENCEGSRDTQEFSQKIAKVSEILREIRRILRSFPYKRLIHKNEEGEIHYGTGSFRND